MARIAIIEDEASVAKAFAKVLVADGHTATIFADRDSAKHGLEESDFDAVILDLVLGADALAFIGIIATIRAKKKKEPPVLVISAEPPSKHRSLCLELGVSDYVQKPIEEATLRIMVNRLLEKSNPRSKAVQTVGSLRYDLFKPGTVWWKRKEIRLPLTAYRILLELVTNNGDVVPHRRLYAELARSATSDSAQLRNNLRAQVKVLRDAFYDVDAGFAALRTVPGGYCWNE